MDSATEVRYAGVVVGRAVPLRERDGAGAFASLAEPLPVGTSISLRIDEAEQLARVTEVVESADPSLAGMRLRFLGASEAVRPAVAVAPAPVTAAPAVDAASGEASPGDAASVESASVDAASVEAPAHAASDPAAVPSPVEGDSGSSGGSGKRRRRRK